MPRTSIEEQAAAVAAAKAAKFMEVCAPRVKRALKSIQLIGNCTNPGAYRFSQEQAEAIVGVLQKAILKLEQDFGMKPKPPKAAGFEMPTNAEVPKNGKQRAA